MRKAPVSPLILGIDFMSPDAEAGSLSVLIVDRRDAADSLALFLRVHGHEVRVAYGVEEALAMVRDWQPDAAVLDTVMRGVDAADLAAQVRKMASGSILLVGLTGAWAQDNVSNVKAGTFDHYFLKPIDPDELLGLLDMHARRRSPGPA